MILYAASKTLEHDGQRFRLRPSGTRLLSALARAHPRTLSHHDLMDALWPDDAPESAVESLKVQVHNLRRDIGRFGLHIGSEYGRGYQLSAPVKVVAE